MGAGTIQELSRELRKPQVVVDLFAERAQSYRNTFDPSTKFFCPRARNGTFACPASFAPELVQGGDKVGGYAEGDGWQWRWFVPGDVSSQRTQPDAAKQLSLWVHVAG